MPDIAMCKDESCEKKETCFRYKAYPSYMQCYFDGTPKVNGECKVYWDLERMNRWFEESKKKPQRNGQGGLKDEI